MSKVATGRGGGLVTPAAPCRCHRRLRRARELGRESAIFTVPTNEIVVQIANSDFNDGLVLVYIDDVLVDTVNVQGEGDLGFTPVTPGFYIEVTGLPLGIHTVTVKSGAIPGCSVEIEDGWYEPCDDLHLDFIAGRQRNGAP
jgi:hypothetical protein